MTEVICNILLTLPGFCIRGYEVVCYYGDTFTCWGCGKDSLHTLMSCTSSLNNFEGLSRITFLMNNVSAQAFVISFSLGMGAIPWLLMAEVISSFYLL